MAAESPPASEKSSVLLYGGTVTSLDGHSSALRPCEILIQRGVVASLGKSLTLMPGTRLLDITGHLVIPGLVATGTELAARALDELAGAGEPGAEALQAALDDESAHALALYAAVRSLLDGVTTLQDEGAPAGAAGLRRALGESGLRIASAPPGGGSRQAGGSRQSGGLDALRGRQDARAALSEATLGAASSLGLEGELGSLAVGKWADLVVLGVEEGTLESTPDDRLEDLALSGRAEVRHVLIAGAQVVADGRAVHHDLEALEAAARAQVARLRAPLA